MSKKSNHFPSCLRHYVSFMHNIADSEIAEENWVKALSCFVDIQPVYDKKPHSIEDFNFGHLVIESLFIIRARYSPDINDKMRILFNDRYFEVKRLINVNERNRYLYIIAQEK